MASSLLRSRDDATCQFDQHIKLKPQNKIPVCNTPGETLPGDIFVSPQTTFPLPGAHCKFDPTNSSLPRQLIWFPRCLMTIGLRDSRESIRTDLTWKSLEISLSNQAGRSYSPPLSSSFVHLLPLLPESRTSERLCQIRDVSEDIICISKDIVSLKARFATYSHKILHRGQLSPSDYFGTF